jgi:hypothetical protein
MGNNLSNYKLHFNIISDKKYAQNVLDNAEHIDFYLEECHEDKANSLARRNLTYSANTISLRDMNYTRAYTENILSSLPIRLTQELEEINIIQLMPTADGGMPHTRPGNIICYPDITQFFSKTTLIHELWHVHQREYKEVWSKAFKRLGWNLWNGRLPEHLEMARRYNPDTIDCPFWSFNDEWVPVPVFKDITRPNVADVEIWFYNIIKQYHITRVPNEIATYFPNLPPSAYEHPREITAYMLSEPEKYVASLGLKHLIESIGQISIMDSKKY